MVHLVPLFDVILCEAGVICDELELPGAQLDLTSRFVARFLKPAHYYEGGGGGPTRFN